MKFATTFSLVSALTSAVSAATASNQCARTVGAAYVLSNDPTGNAVIVHDILDDGSVAYANAVSAGGNGAHGLPASGPPTPDPLFSQGAVVVQGDKLFAVNAGSNTLAAFQIDTRLPSRLTLIGAPVSTGGEFPVSVGASSRTGEVCVLNSGKVANVQCFWLTPRGLTPAHNTLRSLPINQTTPATGPPNTASQVTFSADGKTLFVAVKGIPPATKGYIASWTVGRDGSLTENFVKTSAPMTGLFPFGLTQVPGKNAYLVSDPALGATVYDLTDITKPTYRDIKIANQSLTCWSVYSKATDTYWLSDIGQDALYSVQLDHKTLNATDVEIFKITPFGPVDLEIATIKGKDYLYAISPAAATINVVALEKGARASKFIQNYNFTTNINTSGLTWSGLNLQGMATYIKK